MKKILVVDDDGSVRAVVRRSLAGPETRIVEASDGEMALRIAKEELPDMILLDICLPKMTGFKVCKALRNDPLTREIPVYMVTGLGDIPDQLLGLKSGADEYFTKPIDFHRLTQKVNGRLHLHQPV